MSTAMKEKDGRQWVTATVHDNGLGISQDDQTRLFERFFRGEAAEITKASGAGLGPSICREIIDSQIGRGSSFTLWLPPA